MANSYFSQIQRWLLTFLLITEVLALLVIFFEYSPFITNAEITAAALILIVSIVLMILIARKRTWLFALALMVNMYSLFRPTANGFATQLSFLALPLFIPLLLVLWNEVQTNTSARKIGIVIMSIASSLIIVLACYAAYAIQ